MFFTVQKLHNSLEQQSNDLYLNIELMYVSINTIKFNVRSLFNTNPKIKSPQKLLVLYSFIAVRVKIKGKYH